MTLRQKPFETSYPKWRNVKHGYTVKVLGVRNFRGDHGYYSFVEIEGTFRDPKLRVMISSDVLRRDFVPTGRKKKPKSAAERLLEDDD
jgi:hypothetical protein